MQALLLLRIHRSSSRRIVPVGYGRRRRRSTSPYAKLVRVLLRWRLLLLLLRWRQHRRGSRRRARAHAETSRGEWVSRQWTPPRKSRTCRVVIRQRPSWTSRHMRRTVGRTEGRDRSTHFDLHKSVASPDVIIGWTKCPSPGCPSVGGNWTQRATSALWQQRRHSATCGCCHRRGRPLLHGRLLNRRLLLQLVLLLLICQQGLADCQHPRIAAFPRCGE